MLITKKTDGAKVERHSLMSFKYRCKVLNGPATGNSCGEQSEPMQLLQGSEKIMEGLDNAFTFMRVGEIAKIYVPW